MTADRLERLASHLSATAERPVERSASRWLGEAQAIATDLATGNLDETARTKRLDQLAHLLSTLQDESET